MAKKPTAMVCLAKISWVVTALASINMGLMPFGLDLFQSQFFLTNLEALRSAIFYAIGLCGLISLITFAMHCSGDCKSCNM